MNHKKQSFYVWLASLILSVLILALTAFSEWFGISGFGVNYNVTLPKAFKIATELGRLSGDGSISTVFALIYIALVIIAVSCIATLRSLYYARKEGCYFSKALFISAIGVSLFVMLIVLIANISISSETDGWIDDILRLRATPFLIMAFGVIGCVLNSNCSIDAFSFADLSNAASDTKAPTDDELYCPTCKKAVPDGGKFCAVCGTELVSAMHICPKCGKSIAQDAVFCTNCGCDIANYSEKNKDYTCTCGTTFTQEYIQENNLNFCPQCGKEIKRNDSPTQNLKGVCPACGNYRNNGAFCAICGHAIPPAESSSSTKSKKS